MIKTTMLSVIVAVVMATGSVMADTATFPHGTKEIILEGMFTLENHKGSTRADIQAGYGYFIADNLEVGALASFRKTEWDSEWGINSIWGFGGFAEYNIETGGPWLPYAGFRLLLLDGNDNSDTAINGTFIGGLKIMMTRAAALTIAINFDVASEDIYVIDRKPDNTNLTGKFGFRVFF